ncbi:MAG: stage III sporulation protein AF [Oscillospiraceae bacterium]|nr:stage III sporulation protein AF [Oscillospiraceae bacterium]
MGAVKDWLLSVTAVALIVALAQAMVPEGAVKKIGALIGGMVLLTVLLRPVAALDLEELTRWTAAYVPTEDTEINQGGQMMKSLIAQKTSAYIVDKGAALGLVCEAEVRVETDESGWPVPWEAEITGALSPEQRSALSQALEEELGIPPTRQYFREVAE